MSSSVGVIAFITALSHFRSLSMCSSFFSQRLFNQQLMGAGLFLSAVFTYAYMYTSDNKSLVMDTLGSIGSMLAVLAYAAPLSAMVSGV